MSIAETEYEQCRDAIEAAVKALERSLAGLETALSSADPEISVQGVRDPRRAIRKVCSAYSALEFIGEDGNEEPDNVIGVLGVPAAVIGRATAVNEAKERLKTLCKPLADRRRTMSVTDEHGDTVVKEVYWVRLIAKDIGRPNLNLLAAYRHIPILARRPKRVGYVNAKTRSMYRRSREELIDLLTRSRQAGAEEDIERLRALPQREKFLVDVRESYPSIRANVLYAGVDGGKSERKMIQARLPILYPAGRSNDLPTVSYPGEGGDAPVASSVRPRKLQDEAYLETMTVYRYANPADARDER